MPNRRKGTPTAPKVPGQVTDLMKANLNLLTGENQIVLLAGYYDNLPAVHLAVVVKYGEEFLVFPIARMYSEQDMKKIGDPDNRKTESLDKKDGQDDKLAID